MNPAWRIHKGSAEGAELNSYNDQKWQIVSLPTEASGCINCQGEVWHRKHFRPAAELQGRKLFLHFEGIDPAFMDACDELVYEEKYHSTM